jgi:hypothetical protein
MSASTSTLDSRTRKSARRAPEPAPPRSWIGIDLSAGHGPRRMRALLPLLGLAAIAALGIAALRIDLIRVRYAVAAVMEREETLLEEQRALIVRRRQLLDPIELAVRARKLGFRPPAEVLALPEPDLRNADELGIEALRPEVGAAPLIASKRRDWR